MFYRLLTLLAAFMVYTYFSSHASDAVKSGNEPSIETEHFINLESVRHLNCGPWSGTGEVIGQQRVLTAAHVTSGSTECRDVASKTTGVVVYTNVDLDISVIQFPLGSISSPRMRFSCKGFKTDHTYYSVGWMRGKELVINKLSGTNIISNRIDFSNGVKFNHVVMVRGNIIAGMSGGPIVDANGIMVGTNQATNSDGRSWSRPISETYLCKK